MILSAYALKKTDSKSLNSASGGAFIAVAQAFFEAHPNGIAFAVELINGKNIRYSSATSLEECSKFQGSKYVESNIIECRDEVISCIQNKPTLVVGLPCQIYALKQYIKHKSLDEKNLITIDIMCHGTPQKNFWNDYTDWLEAHYNSNLIDYSFRYQKAKWNNYPAMAEFSNGKRYINTMEVKLYNKLFLSGLILKEGCFSCHFANQERPGDITLADFWGIEDVLPEFKVQKSTSLVLCNSNIGEQLVGGALKQNNMHFMKCRNKNYVKYQHNLSTPTAKPIQLEKFRTDYKSYGFDYCIKKYCDYSLKGQLVFYIKKSLNELGLVDLVKRVNQKMIRS